MPFFKNYEFMQGSFIYQAHSFNDRIKTIINYGGLLNVPDSHIVLTLANIPTMLTYSNQGSISHHSHRIVFNLIFYTMKRISNWTDQEDKMLLKLYNQVDCFQKWKYISQKFYEEGFCKNEIQCRERFVNKLNPDLRQGRLEKEEVQALFKFYDQYGPLWSVFESLIPGRFSSIYPRSQNLLKNKFYSMLRSLVRILLGSVDLEDHQQNVFPSAAISSKLLVEIYEGKKKFRKYKGFLSSILKDLDFELDQQKFNSICAKDEANLRIIKNIKSQISKSITGLKIKGSQKPNSHVCKKEKVSADLIINQKPELANNHQKPLADNGGGVRQSALLAFCPPMGYQEPEPPYSMEAMNSSGCLMYFLGYYVVNEPQIHQKVI